MINSDLIKQLQGFGKDADRVLVEFPDIGGPYRSPDSVAPLIGTDDVIINTIYPRKEWIVRDLFIELQQYPSGGNAQLYLSQGGSAPSAYYEIRGIRIHERGIVLIAGQVIAT